MPMDAARIAALGAAVALGAVMVPAGSELGLTIGLYLFSSGVLALALALVGRVPLLALVGSGALVAYAHASLGGTASSFECQFCRLANPLVPSGYAPGLARVCGSSGNFFCSD